MSLFRDPLSGKLTQPDAELTRKARATFPGMAYLAYSGPDNMTCRDCLWWRHLPYDYHSKTGKYGGMIKPAACGKFRELTGKQGDLVPHDAPACKYFQLNRTPPSRYQR